MKSKPMVKYTIPLPEWIIKEFRRIYGTETRSGMRSSLEARAEDLRRYRIQKVGK